MAKSGGMLNAICAKLLKSTSTSNDTSTAETYDTDAESTQADVENNNAPINKENVIADEEQVTAVFPQDIVPSFGSLWSGKSVSSKRAKSLDTLPSAFHTLKKSRRKNTTPRNLAQLHEDDEISKNETEEVAAKNNRSVGLANMPTAADQEGRRQDETDTEMMALDLSSSVSNSTRDSESLTTSSSSVQIETLAAEEYTMDNTGALDLSVSKSSKSSASFSDSTNSTSLHSSLPSSYTAAMESDDSSCDSISAEVYCHVKPFNTLSLPPTMSVAPVRGDNTAAPHGSDATDMKNYAQNTMNELLSLYGLGKQEAESITESVSLENFSSGNILARQIPPAVLVEEKLTTTPSPTLSSTAGQKNKPTPRKPASEFNGNTPDAAFTVPQGGENEAYNKLADKFSKLSKLPQGAMLTEQMKEILLAAALLKHKSSSPGKNLLFSKGGVAVTNDTSPLEGSTSGLPINLADGTSSRNRNSYDSHVARLRGLTLDGPGVGPTALPFSSTASQLITSPRLLPASGKSGGNKFATSSDYVKACFSAGEKLGTNVPVATSTLLPDYSKYVKRFTTYIDCKDKLCKDMAYKEHFHCMDCNFKVFVKKEEMIRHFKWHKKREESLQHGFLRFSPIDDCTVKFGACTHNGKQTHYHCLQTGCNKVYISTSDVQMHSNYHRKDSAIIQEGFQRFRATEDCGETSCSFYGQRTTHFHCRRPVCKFTFKNKADMEKHKAYHQKDEALAKDGFKKFMKYEPCNFTGCRYSNTANHIHCIRSGCDYVLHSTGQLFSHKRKHERRDFEHAYRRFKDGQRGKGHSNEPPKTAAPPTVSAAQLLANLSPALVKLNTNILNLSDKPRTKQEPPEYVDLEDLREPEEPSSAVNGVERHYPKELKIGDIAHGQRSYKVEPIKIEDSDEHEPISKQALPSTLAKLASKLTTPNSSLNLDDSLNLPIPDYDQEFDELQDSSVSGVKDELQNGVVNHGGIPTNVPGFVPKVSPPINDKKEKDESWKKYLTRYTANDPCHPRCDFLYKDHYHCNNGGCGIIFRSKDGVREHARHHEQQDRMTLLSYRTVEEDEVCEDCQETSKHYHCLWASCKTVVLNSDVPFARLEHHKIHEYARAATNKQSRPFNMYKIQNDSFRRRRGRPPKYPKNAIPVVPKIDMSDEEITGALSKMGDVGSSSTLVNGFVEFNEGQPCPDDKCFYFLKRHYHCVRPRCHHATDRSDVLNLHAKDFHNYISILEGFEFFDRNVNCRRSHCHNNKANKHFHCMRPRCDYSFVRYSTMSQHDKKHRMSEMSGTKEGHAQDSSSNDSTTSQAIQMNGSVGNLAYQMMGAAPLNLTSQSVKGTTMVSPLQSPVTITPPAAHGAKPQPAISPRSTEGDNSMVKTKGTFFPLSGLSPDMSAAVNAALAVRAKMDQTGGGQAANSLSVMATQSPSVTVSSAGNLVNIAPKPTSPLPPGTRIGDAQPLTMLLQQKGPHSTPQLNWLTLKMKMHYGVLQNCGRPFCKLKKKDHYHCFDCNQAFSDPVRLRSHVSKHGLKVDKYEKVQQPRINPALLGNPAITVPYHQSLGNDALQVRKQLASGGGIVNIAPEEASNYRAVIDDEDRDEFDDDEEDVNVSSSLNLNPNTFSNMLNKSANLSMNTAPAQAAADMSMIKPSYDHQEDNIEDDEENSKINIDAPLVIDEELDEENDIDNEQNFIENSGSPMADEEYESNPYPSNSPQEMAAGSTKGRKKSSGRRSSRKRSIPKHTDFIDSDAAYAKQRKIDKNIKAKPKTAVKTRTSPRAKIVEHGEESTELYVTESSDADIDAGVIVGSEAGSETALDGFRRYHFGQDCGKSRCTYRASGSHWHCLQANCTFALNDRTRAAAHRQKHAQVKAMLGDDFEHYSAKSNCERADCEHAMTSAHFHCKKCAYITTISNKVQVHRRQHEREEYISQSGFVQYSGLTDCQTEWCTYNSKQTHYHCAVQDCKHSTTGLAQMKAHKSKKHHL